MPALVELKQGIIDKLGLHDLRPAVREETRQSMELRKKLHTLLGGNKERQFHLKQSIYSAWAWNFPTDITVVETPQRTELTVQTHSDRPYGMRIRLDGSRVSLFELVFQKDPMPDLVDPGGLAHKIVDRVIEATSADPEIQFRYQQMRAREHRDFEAQTAIHLLPSIIIK